jgi:hypothetical protein
MPGPFANFALIEETSSFASGWRIPRLIFKDEQPASVVVQMHNAAAATRHNAKEN